MVSFASSVINILSDDDDENIVGYLPGLLLISGGSQSGVMLRSVSQRLGKDATERRERTSLAVQKLGRQAEERPGQLLEDEGNETKGALR